MEITAKSEMILKDGICEEKITKSFVMDGLDRADENCLHSVEEAVSYIESVGFLPLFKNDIKGFSLEEHTASSDWWSGDAQKDPWVWREIIARRKTIAYGKFFDKKAGFITEKWLPVFANYRRDGYDFDALYEDGKAPSKHKKLMNSFMEENADAELLSNELKQIAGFDKGGEKGFESAVTALMMQTYLCNCDFKRKKNKKGQEYGWPVAVYTAPEHLWDNVTDCYKEEPKESFQKLLEHMKEMFPDADEAAIIKILK